MDFELFNKNVIEHRNSLILIGLLVLIFAIIGAIVVEVYVRKASDCEYFEIGKFKFSPTILMLALICAIITVFSIKIVQCNLDINGNLYEEYIGKVDYSSSTVKFCDTGFSVFVGKGHEIIPPGISYGKVVISKYANVIVQYKAIDR